MPNGLFIPDARNTGGRRQIIKSFLQHQDKIATARPAVFVPRKQRKARKKMKRKTMQRLLETVPKTISKLSPSRRKQKNESKREFKDDVEDLNLKNETKLDEGVSTLQRSSYHFMPEKLSFTDMTNLRNRPARPQHHMELSKPDTTDINIPDLLENDSTFENEDNSQTIYVGSYVRLIPTIDTFGCLHFGDRGIVTRMVNNRNFSVPYRPYDAQVSMPFISTIYPNEVYPIGIYQTSYL